MLFRSTETYSELLASDCVWLQFWAEFASELKREEFRFFVDNYVREQQKAGRFPRPLNNLIPDIPTWLEINDVIGDESRIQVALAILFLLVCLLNTVGLMLSKCLSSAPISGIRRALGATRLDIIRHHLAEAAVIGALGGALGILLAFGGLALIRVSLHWPKYQGSGDPDALLVAESLSHLDGEMLALAVLISVGTGILAGLYPAWRIGRLSPVLFIKAQ